MGGIDKKVLTDLDVFGWLRLRGKEGVTRIGPESRNQNGAGDRRARSPDARQRGQPIVPSWRVLCQHTSLQRTRQHGQLVAPYELPGQQLLRVGRANGRSRVEAPRLQIVGG